MVNLEQGGIVNVGEVIKPQHAIELGGSMLRIIDEYRASGEILGSGFFLRPSTAETSSLRSGTNVIDVGLPEQRVIDWAAVQLRDFTGVEGDLSKFDSIVFGRRAVNAWHIDSDEAWRMLVNLSTSTIGLEVATEWDPNDYLDEYGFMKDDPPQPAQYETIEYNPGEGLLVNNICDRRLRKPHRGSDEAGKVILRLTTRSI